MAPTLTRKPIKKTKITQNRNKINKTNRIGGNVNRKKMKKCVRSIKTIEKTCPKENEKEMKNVKKKRSERKVLRPIPMELALSSRSHQLSLLV